MKTKKIVKLTKAERKELEDFSTNGRHNAHLIKRARVILELDVERWLKPKTQEAIADMVGLSRQAINDIKSDFLKAENISEFLQRKKRKTPPIEPKITGDVEAHIIALACGEVPEGFSRWTVRLLAQKSVELNYIDSVSPITINRLLKKINLSLI